MRLLCRLFVKGVLVCLILLMPQASQAQANRAAGVDSQANYVDDAADPDAGIEVYRGPSIVVNVAGRQLKLYDENKSLIKTYPIAVGSPGYRTPLGPRSMKQIVWNAWWLPPKSPWAEGAKPTPPGKGNPLGSIKMDLGKAILFHGTNKPNSIGKAASHGCMRMYTQDARELARWIQEHNSDQVAPENFDNYDKHSGRSFYVKLNREVPVDIIYEAVEIDGDNINVFQDVYGKVRDKVALIREKLAMTGHNVDEFDWAYIKEQVKSIKRSDVSFSIPSLLVKNRTQNNFAIQEDHEKGKL